MKTRMVKMMGWMVVLVAMISFTSCEVEFRSWYDDEYCENSYKDTRSLCSRTWEESWYENGVRYTQRLDFYVDVINLSIVKLTGSTATITAYRYTAARAVEAVSMPTRATLCSLISPPHQM